LNQFPEYVEFRTPKNEAGEAKAESMRQSVPEFDKWTPEDHLEHGYQKKREQLTADLLARIKDA
jgi:restriction endonuclease Mrr